MLQQVMTNPKEITFNEVPVPEIKADQVLVKIMKIGVCQFQMQKYVTNMLIQFRLLTGVKYQKH